MSYYIDKDTILANVFIASSDTKSAFEAVKSALLDEHTRRGGIENRLSWINKNDLDATDSFIQLMEECRWEPTFDELGNVIKLKFTGQKIGEEQLIFELLAPFVKDGSVIEYVSDGYLTNVKHAYRFRDGKVDYASEGIEETNDSWCPSYTPC